MKYHQIVYKQIQDLENVPLLLKIKSRLNVLRNAQSTVNPPGVALDFDEAQVQL